MSMRVPTLDVSVVDLTVNLAKPCLLYTSVNGQAIRITAERNPADLKGNEVGAEYVVESTGLFLSKDKAQAHIGVSSILLIALNCSKVIFVTPNLVLRAPLKVKPVSYTHLIPFNSPSEASFIAAQISA